MAVVAKVAKLAGLAKVGEAVAEVEGSVAVVEGGRVMIHADRVRATKPTSRSS